MNLYQVMPNYEYTYFVFAKTRNKAKAACVRRYVDEGEEYTDMRCKTLVKDVPSHLIERLNHIYVIGSPGDEGYEVVKELGFEYETVCDQR